MKKIRKKNNTKNILISSFTETKFSFYQYLSLAKNIYSKKSLIFVANIKKNYFHDYFENFLKMPNCSKKNLVKIYKILKRYNITIVFPTSDRELNFWSKNYEYFKSKNIEIHVMKYSEIKHFVDKNSFYKYCKKNKILTPEIFNSKEISNTSRFVLKEAQSGSKKIIYVNIDAKKIRTYIKKFHKPLIQEFINGEEYSIDTWKEKNDNNIELIVRKRLIVKNGDSKITEVVKNKLIIKNIKRELMKFNYYNHCVFQGILSKNKFYFIECNPRIGGASVAGFEYSIKSIHYFLAKVFKKTVKYKKKTFIRQYKFETTYYK